MITYDNITYDNITYDNRTQFMSKCITESTLVTVDMLRPKKNYMMMKISVFDGKDDDGGFITACSYS